MAKLIEALGGFSTSILFLTALFAGNLYASEIYNEADWSTYVIDLSGHSSTPKKMGNSLKRDGFYYFYNVNQARGKWLRVSANGKLTEGDFQINVSTYDKEEKTLNNKYFPTQCENTTLKTCSTSFWVDPKVESISVMFSWDKKAPATPQGIRYQIARSVSLNPDDSERLKTVAEYIKQHYYRRAEVDWDKLITSAERSLVAPAGVDPVPRAVWAIIGSLPEQSDTHVFPKYIPLKDASRTLEAAQSDVKNIAALEDKLLPTCKKINLTVWRLDLPGTFYRVGNNWISTDTQKYVDKAHACLTQRGAVKWVVNLTEQDAGSFTTAIAALAPLLKTGALITLKKPQGDETIFIDNFSIRGSEEYLRWKSAFPPFKGNVDFIINKNCGGNVCGRIVTAVRGHGRILGQQSTTISASNEIKMINDSLILQLTENWLVDAEGKSYTNIQPTVSLTDKEIEQALDGTPY